jgi:ABC-type transporter Mla maintaining outer membrane lipid asymmetry ATPase subunit MlaF
VLLVTHDPNEAARIATRTAFIADGKVALFGSTEAVLKSDNAAVRDYLGS